MEELNVVDGINNASTWLTNNQDLLIQYAVNLIAALLILIVGSVIAKVVSGAVNRVMRLRGIDITVADFLAAMVRYSILAFTIVAVLGRLGVQTASVIAVIGAAGLAVGLALQGSLSNFAAGVLLVAFRPFRAGEYVDLGGVAGTVVQVQIFSTTLRTVDDKIIVVPNGKIIANNIINTSREPNRRTDITVGVAYDADIDVVKKVLGDIIAGDKRILHDKGVIVRLNEMAASSLNFTVRVWTTNGDALEVYWDLQDWDNICHELTQKPLAELEPLTSTLMLQLTLENIAAKDPLAFAYAIDLFGSPGYIESIEPVVAFFSELLDNPEIIAHLATWKSESIDNDTSFASIPLTKVYGYPLAGSYGKACCDFIGPRLQRDIDTSLINLAALGDQFHLFYRGVQVFYVEKAFSFPQLHMNWLHSA